MHLWDYKQRRNLLLLFADEEASGYLQDIAAHYDTYRELETEVLVVLALDVERAQPLYVGGTLPFLLLLDPAGVVRKTYLGDKPVGLVVIDRFGIIYAVYAALRSEHLPSQAEVVSWLRYIELQCPECGIGAWRSV